MKIVHVYKDYYPPTVGGIEQTAERLAVQMVRRGAEVTVLTSHPKVKKTVEETIDGVRIIRCAEWGRALSAPFCPDMPYQMSRLRADLWHLHYPSPPGEVSWLTVRPRGGMVVTWHGDITRQKFALPVYRHFVQAILREADAVMQTYERQADVSPFLREFKHKCHVVPLGIELEAFERRPEHAGFAAELRARYGSPIVLSVGRLVGYKGIDVLLEAASRIEGKVLIVGGGPEAERLKARAAGMVLGDKVVFIGRVEPAKVIHYVAAADVGVLPSIAPQETFGLSMVEMMAHGLPVVCTELNTGTSFVNQHGESGLVVTPGNPVALADAINQLLRDETMRRRLGQGAAERTHRLFSTDAMMRGVIDVYESVLQRKRAA